MAFPTYAPSYQIKLQSSEESASVRTSNRATKLQGTNTYYYTKKNNAILQFVWKFFPTLHSNRKLRAPYTIRKYAQMWTYQQLLRLQHRYTNSAKPPSHAKPRFWNRLEQLSLIDKPYIDCMYVCFAQSAIPAIQSSIVLNEKNVIMTAAVAHFIVKELLRPFTIEGYCLYLKKEEKVVIFSHIITLCYIQFV